MKDARNSDHEAISDFVREVATTEHLKKQRYDLASWSSLVLSETGNRLHVFGHLIGTDRREGKSPFGHGSDETVAVSVLLRIGGQLISATADMLVHGKPYAGAALLRQIVEIEYLAWAFETRDRDAELWLRSDRQQREAFFRPAKLRKAAEGRFRSQDYGYHCELGGHPVPNGTILLSGDEAISQLFLSDLLGHAGRIWDHVSGWAMKMPNGEATLVDEPEMPKRFQAWKAADPLSQLPPPP